MIKKEISLIVGPRQVGKTTIMNEIKKYLDKKGEKSIFLILDYESDLKGITYVSPAIAFIIGCDWGDIYKILLKKVKLGNIDNNLYSIIMEI